jgi:tetratricopeptide (TPR) repeat protein
MYNLLISLGIGLALFAVTGLIGGNWLAGIIPATIGLGVAYFLLARRSGQQLQAIMERAMLEFNALENMQPPRTQREATRMQKLQRDKLASGRAIIEEGFKLTRWQFLIDSQIHAQLGSLEYMQQNYEKAVVHLEKAWSRHWQAQAMLACIDFREKRYDEALARMEKADGPGGSDALFWAIYIWIAYKAGKRDRALAVANQGVKKHEDSKSLKSMATAIANKKPLRPDAFAPGWYQFFPEDMPQAKEMAKNAKKHGNAPNVRRGGYSFPHPKR